MAANRLQHQFINDMTGGVNLRADAFQLADNEVADILNMEVDARGGCVSRRGWERWNATDVTAGTWAPTNAHMFNQSGASPRLMVANDDKVLHSTNGTFVTLDVSATPIVADAGVHGASFAQWSDDIYIACGTTRPMQKWDGSGDSTPLTAAAAANWNDDYLSVVGGVGPMCEHTVTHAGYLFVANTREDSVNHPNRLRWSHPNAPTDWAEDDFIDFLNMPAITALVPFGDHLLIFSEHSIEGLFGYSQDSWQVTQIAQHTGVASPNAVARAENAVYFFSWPDGVFCYDGETITEMSTALRPIFDAAGGFNGGETDAIFLGWLNRRLWFAAPYLEGSAVTEATTVFVFDPTLPAWVIHRGADDSGLGPFVEDSFTAVPRFFACSRTTPDVMLVDRSLDAIDEHGGTDASFASHFVTRWVDGGTPDGKKSWKRPTFVAKEQSAEYDLGYEVYHNYDEARIKRSKNLSVETGSDAWLWGDGTLWGDGSVWGAAPKGARLEKGTGLGSAAAVQLKVSATLGKRWGVDGINFKFINRRYT